MVWAKQYKLYYVCVCVYFFFFFLREELIIAPSPTEPALLCGHQKAQHKMECSTSQSLNWLSAILGIGLHREFNQSNSKYTTLFGYCIVSEYNRIETRIWISV